MTWWKKILTSIPLLIAGYEVGKSSEDDENKQLVEILKNSKQVTNDHSVNADNDKLNYVEILSIVGIIIIAVIYLIKIICKTIKNNGNNSNQPQQQI